MALQPTTQVSGGQKLAHRLKQLEDRLSRNSDVFVGVPAAAGAYEDGTQIVTVAVVQEYGSADGRIPERSFLRVPLRANKQLFQQIFRNGLPEVVDESLTLRQLLEQVGARAVGVSQEAISEGIAPENAESTKQRKERKGKGTTPLIDEGQLRQSITFVVSEGRGDES